MSPDLVTSFYDDHPYPPPISDLRAYAELWSDGARRRVEHHRMWPHLPYRDDHDILVAGCGTSQAAKYAIRYPNARITAIDVSRTSVEHTRALADAERLDHLDVHQLPIEEVGELDNSFDHIVCTGVLHHLADPAAGLRALRDALAPQGALSAMVYAPYGRSGVYMIQDYCRLLGIQPTPGDIAELIDALRELPVGHPLGHLLRSTPDFQHDDALADALLHPRDRSYSVPELLAWLRDAGLTFGRWARQAPYLPTCGSMSELAHGERIAELPIEHQWAALELFRGTMTRHSFVAHRNDESPASRLDPSDDAQMGRWVPVRPTTVVGVEERLPPNAAAALLNRAHEFTDLVMFVDEAQFAAFQAIDGDRTVAEIAPRDPSFFPRLYHHDLVVFDTSRP